MSSKNADIDKEIIKLCEQYFGIKKPHAFQVAIIKEIIGSAQSTLEAEKVIGEDRKPYARLLIAPTGMGKSLCFSAPLLWEAQALIPRLSLIIYPLRSLIMDQERRFRASHIVPIVLLGGQSPEQRQAAWLQLKDCMHPSTRKPCVILSTPELVQSPSIITRLQAFAMPLHLIIDEAHSFTLWGKSFRPSYRSLVTALKELDIRHISACTATAPKDIQKDLEDELFLPILGIKPRVLELNPDRPNICYVAYKPLHPLLCLGSILAEAERPVLVFCRTRADTVNTQYYIKHCGIEKKQVWFYHAGLDKEVKLKIEEAFFASQDGILCATSAYGMGVDKPNIRSVIHLAMPSELVDYMQESGRAGRDQRPSTAYLPHAVDHDNANRVCIRAGLLAALQNSMQSLMQSTGANDTGQLPQERCCSVCNPALKEKLGRDQGELIRKLVRRYPASFTRASLAHLLEYGSYPQGFPQRLRSFKKLTYALDHRRYQGIAADVVDALIAQDYLRESTHIFWYQKLFCTHKKSRTCLFYKIFRYCLHERTSKYDTSSDQTAQETS